MTDIKTKKALFNCDTKLSWWIQLCTDGTSYKNQPQQTVDVFSAIIGSELPVLQDYFHWKTAPATYVSNVLLISDLFSDLMCFFDVIAMLSCSIS